MSEPRFLTQWEREDYEREKRGEAPLGPGQIMPRARNADTFDVWSKPPPLLRTLTERQERALKRYVAKVARKVYRIAYDCGVAAVTPEKKD